MIGITDAEQSDNPPLIKHLPFQLTKFAVSAESVFRSYIRIMAHGPRQCRAGNSTTKPKLAATVVAAAEHAPRL